MHQPKTARKRPSLMEEQVTEYTHADLKIGTMYTSGSYPAYVLQRLKKGETGDIKSGTTIKLPPQLSTICGIQCELLKDRPSCSNHHKAGVVQVPVWNSGDQASLQSYVVATLYPSPDKSDPNNLWQVRLTQVTSRSIGNQIQVSILPEVDWNTMDWERKNMVIMNLADSVWQVLGAPVSKSQQLTNTADANLSRAVVLFKQLVEKMLTDDHKRAQFTTGLPAFRDRQTFLAAIGGASGQYSSYNNRPPSHAAFMHELVLKSAQRQYPGDVAEILECYKKVKQAETMEEVPFTWDQKVVRAVMQSRLFTKPSAPAEVMLPTF